MKKRVITISRQFGSGGHSIGKAVAETLGISFTIRNCWRRLKRKQGFQRLSNNGTCVTCFKSENLGLWDTDANSGFPIR